MSCLQTHQPEKDFSDIKTNQEEKKRDKCLKMNNVRGHWAPKEDEVLRTLVAKDGPKNWNIIAQSLPPRSGKSCRLRWLNQLDPKIDKRPFSESDYEKLIEVHKIYGNKWCEIVKHFPGRTDNAVKNQYHVLMARRKRRNKSVAPKKRETFHEDSMDLSEKETNNIITRDESCGETTEDINKGHVIRLFGNIIGAGINGADTNLKSSQSSRNFDSMDAESTSLDLGMN